MKYCSFIAFFAFLSFCSCKKGQHGPPPDLVATINSSIQILPAEILGTKNFRLYCHTERVFTCGNCRLISSVEQNGNNIIIDFKNVVIPYDCANFRDSFHAVGDIIFKPLANGTYNLTIKNEAKQSSGTLTVTDENYSFAFTSLNDIVFSEYKVMRIPVNTIWGSVYFSDTSIYAVANTFTDSLEYFGAQPFSGQPGYYSNFKLDSILHFVNAYADTLHHKYFIYKYMGDKSKIEPLMRRFAEQHLTTYYQALGDDGRNYQWPIPVTTF